MDYPHFPPGPFIPYTSGVPLNPHGNVDWPRRIPAQHLPISRAVIPPPRRSHSLMYSPNLGGISQKVIIRQQGGAICSLPKEDGLCRASFPRFFFDVETGECQQFTYGGCRGNKNNFLTIESCKKACMGDVQYLIVNLNPEPEGHLQVLTNKFQSLHDMRERIGEEDHAALSKKFQLLKDMRKAVSTSEKAGEKEKQVTKQKKSKKSKRVKKSKGQKQSGNNT